MIRTRAIEGLRALALAGNDAARSALEELLASSSLSIRFAAAHALLQLPERERAAVEPRLRQALGDEYEAVVNLRPVTSEQLHSSFALRVDAAGVARAAASKPGPPGERRMHIPTRRPGRAGPRVAR